MQKFQRVNHEFPPVFDKRSRVLMLGTMPSPKSRENGFYYGHPRNRFWPVLAQVCQSPCPQTPMMVLAEHQQISYHTINNFRSSDHANELICKVVVSLELVSLVVSALTWLPTAKIKPATTAEDNKTDFLLSFNRNLLANFLEIAPNSASKIIQKCREIGIMRMEKRGVYFFTDLG